MTQTLITKDKDYFIIVSNINSFNYIISPFNIENNITKPGLIVDINRYLRCQTLMKDIPDIFKMNSDGDKIYIDVISKVLELNISNGSGFINYNILDNIVHVNSIFIKQIPNQIINFIVDINDETKNIPKTLKVFSSIFYNGCILCAVDTIEKVLHTSILDPDIGLLGKTHKSEYKNILTIMKIWPELNITFQIIKNDIELYSEEIKRLNVKPGIISLHKNFGNNHINIEQNYMLYECEPNINPIKDDILLIIKSLKKYHIIYIDNKLILYDLSNLSEFQTTLKSKVIFESSIKQPNKLIDKILEYTNQYKPKHNTKFINIDYF